MAKAKLARGLPDLFGALKKIPGCLGVEAATTESGKQVLFAWFRDKQAVLDWYYGEMHRRIQDNFFPGRPAHTPLKDVPEDIGPLMAVASLIMPSGQAAGSFPFPQISIELHAPITGGIFIGSRFAPDSFRVPGMIDYTPRPGKATTPSDPGS